MKQLLTMTLCLILTATIAYAGTIKIEYDPDEYDVRIEKKQKGVIFNLFPARFESYSSSPPNGLRIRQGELYTVPCAQNSSMLTINECDHLQDSWKAIERMK